MGTRSVPLTHAVRCERGTAKYVRQSTGALAAISADVAAIDHDADRRALGVLIERRAENLLLQSQDFETLPWKVNATATLVDDTDPGPDNQTPCHLLTVPGGSDGLYQQVYGLTAGETYTFSVFLRSTTGTDVSASIGGINGAGAVTVTVEPGWNRFSITDTASGASRYPKISAIGITGPVTLQVWGAMLEVGTRASSYVRSTDAIKVRGRDLLVSDDLDWLYQGEGTFLVEGTAPATWEDFTRFFQLYSTVLNDDHVDLNYSATADQVRLSIRLQQQQILDQATFGAVATGADFRLALAYRDNDIAVANAGEVIEAATGARVIPRNLQTMVLGSYDGTDQFLDGWIKRVSYWPRRLTNTRLMEVTQ